MDDCFLPCALVIAIPTMKLNGRVVFNTWPALDSTPIFLFATARTQLSNGGNTTIRSGSTEDPSSYPGNEMMMAPAGGGSDTVFLLTPLSLPSRKDQGILVNLFSDRRTHRILEARAAKSMLTSLRRNENKNNKINYFIITLSLWLDHLL